MAKAKKGSGMTKKVADLLVVFLLKQVSGDIFYGLVGRFAERHHGLIRIKKKS